MSAGGSNDDSFAAPAFTPLPDTSVVSDDLSRVLEPGEGEGWLARRNLIPLGYLGDEAKTARTFPRIGSTRWSVPGDRARLLADGNSNCWAAIRSPSIPAGRRSSLKRSSARSRRAPGVYDVVVVGRPSERWGSEVVAVVQLVEDIVVTDDDLVEEARKHIASYKLPKAIVRVRRF